LKQFDSPMLIFQVSGLLIKEAPEWRDRYIFSFGLVFQNGNIH
jgi:hypothetical protein